MLVATTLSNVGMNVGRAGVRTYKPLNQGYNKEGFGLTWESVVTERRPGCHG